MVRTASISTTTARATTMTDHAVGRLMAASRPAGGVRMAGRVLAVGNGVTGPRTRPHRPAARMVIVGWVLVVTFGVLAMVNIASRQALLAQVDEQVASIVSAHAEEFTLVAARGVDPDTARPYAEVGALLTDHLQRQSPDDDDILFGVVDDATGAGPAGSRVRQADEPPYDVSADVALRSTILASPAAAGSIDTPAGELRWEKRRVGTAPDAATPSTGWFVAGLFIDRERAEVFGSMRTLLLYSALGLVLAGFGAWLVSGRILAPVRMMRSVAAEITERDLTRRIDVDGNDEMAALAVQFNGMLDRLQDAFTGQNRFIDAAAHELRTPLTIVRGNLEMMDLGMMGDDPPSTSTPCGSGSPTPGRGCRRAPRRTSSAGSPVTVSPAPAWAGPGPGSDSPSSGPSPRPTAVPSGSARLPDQVPRSRWSCPVGNRSSAYRTVRRPLGARVGDVSCATSLRQPHRLCCASSSLGPHPGGRVQGGTVSTNDPSPPAEPPAGATPASSTANLDWQAVEADPDFQELRRRLRGFVFPVTGLFLGWYVLYVLVATFAPGFMAIPLLGNINLGLLFGLLQFVSTFAITAWYIRFANRRLDPLAAKIRDDLGETQ